MKEIYAHRIKEIVSHLCIEANTLLRKDVLKALKIAFKKEKNKRAKKILEVIIKNAFIAKKENLPICQDTGFPLVFLEIGNIKIKGDLNRAVNEGIVEGYRRGYLRNSVIKDPLRRKVKSDFVPGLIHTQLKKTNHIKITVFPQGFGCENKTQLKMFSPTAKLNQIKEFIINTVRKAGPDACPPFVVGVGIGGTADYACFLAKKALLKKVTSYKLEVMSYIPKLEKDLLREINRLNIGPMGLGGKTTCLAVNIETYPTHIAGLPVAVSISCHALRSAIATL